MTRPVMWWDSEIAHICSMAKECKYDGECSHKTPHSKDFICDRQCNAHGIVDISGYKKKSYCLPVEGSSI